MLSKKAIFLFNKLDHFFEGNRDENLFLTFFRVGVSLVAMIEIASLGVDLHLFFSLSETLIPQELMYLESGYFKYFDPFYQFLENYGLTGYFYYVSISAYFLSLFFLLIGLFTRYSAVISLILQVIIFRSFVPFNYGYDYFLTMSLFYCVVFPVGKYSSADSEIFNLKNNLYFNYRRVLQLHLAIAYFFSGIAKALDSGWWNGRSVWNALASIDNLFYSFSPFILAITGIATVFLELTYSFWVMNSATRKYVIIAIVLMHASIAITMGLYAFSSIMIVWNIAAYGNLLEKNESIYVETS